MAKKVAGEVKLQLVSGQATPQPPVGPSLAPYMINLQEFIKSFNAQTQHQTGMVVTTIITCYSDRSFAFSVKSPPAAILLKSAAKIVKGSGEPNRNKVASVKMEQIREIAQVKMNDMNAIDIEGAMRQLEGTARQMGIKVAN